ncbi:MAG: pyridoxal phosphate-dependent aminotransferase [Fulvimarina manganoxydans]|uniref:pyridoxal phosphate-dependent aminotransferase n=1 Tax=Fulvimarina manganoxydans TaxID=937218 RepID=UPI0023575D4B|nr:pyridoxal phosphate-dependent aminotransferase [Fulvimarina manganoxydans]MCK5932850.1 pyridoxal phosphate-dependent aminotransferase [Fulvimarina manganoxydans]
MTETERSAERFSPRVRALPSTIPFVGPEALERRLGSPFKARLGANESVFGPSPRAVSAMADAAALSWAYGDAEQLDLRQAISRKLGLTPDHVVAGEGIDGLLRDLVQAAMEPGDVAVTSLGAYPTFNYHVTAHGGVLDFVPYAQDFRQDWPALVARARVVRPKILYLTNPDNPTGSWHNAEALEAVLRDVPEETLIVLDEAYADFAPAEALPKTTRLAPNLLRFRTFSKAYGMAGVRVGFVFGEPEAIAQFGKVRNHFGLSRMAQAGALAALGDDDHLRETVEKVAAGRKALAELARAKGLVPLASGTNFVAIDLGRDGAYARAVLDAVLRRGVFIRMPGAAPLDRMIRVSVGTPADIALFGEALEGALEEVNADRPLWAAGNAS